MRQFLRQIIQEWHTRELPKIKKREVDIHRYLTPTISKIVSIVGFRRSGKTYLLFDLAKTLNREDCLYINFEDERIPEDAAILTELSNILVEFYGDRKITLILDEIQNMPNWSKWLRRMLDTHRYTIFISGSSSKLSPAEIPTELRGRSLTVYLFPLSFAEYLEFLNKNIKNLSHGVILNILREYLIFGGFPEIALVERGKKYLIIEDYFSTFITRDIFERYNVRQKAAFKEVLRLLLNSTYFTINKIANILKNAGYNIGKGTLANYIHYLQESLFLYPVEFFSPKAKERIQYPRKAYFIDNFLIYRFTSGISSNISRLMENTVALELIKKTKKDPTLDIFYWKDYSRHEIDFVVKKHTNIKELIQVSYVASEIELNNREIKSLIKGSHVFNTSNLKIITWDLEKELKVKNKTIALIPLWKWLLQHKL